MATAAGTFSAGGGNAFSVFSGMDIIMLIVGIVTIVWAATGAGLGINLPPYSGWIVAGLGIAIFGFALGWDLEYSNAGIGAWLGLVATIAIAYGAFAASANPAPRAATRAEPPAPAAPPPPPARSA